MQLKSCGLAIRLLPVYRYNLFTERDIDANVSDCFCRRLCVSYTLTQTHSICVLLLHDVTQSAVMRRHVQYVVLIICNIQVP